MPFGADSSSDDIVNLNAIEGFEANEQREIS
jgi:hypothetical protein